MPSLRDPSIALGACATSSISAIPCSSQSCLQAVDGRRVAGVVDRADGLRAGRDAPLDVLRVDARVLARDDLREHRRRAAVQGRGGGRGERERRHDHLVARADPRGEVGEVQRRRAARDGDRVARAEVLGELLLEGGCARAEREPARAQRLGDRLAGPAAAAAGRRAVARGRSPQLPSVRASSSEPAATGRSCSGCRTGRRTCRRRAQR